MNKKSYVEHRMEPCVVYLPSPNKGGTMVKKI